MEASSARSGRDGSSAFAVSGVMLAVLLAMSAPETHAAGFGEVEVASQLGERLYARVPLVGEGAADVAPECVKLIPESALQDAPALSNPRLGIDRRSSPPAVVVSTPAPVMEPAVRFVLELGCGNRLRREFVLLIDPPDLPAVQTAGTPALLPPAARIVPREESRWGANAGGSAAVPAAPTQSAAPQPMFDAPLAEPAVQAPPAPRKAAPKPRPKPAAKPQVAQAQPASAPPPPVRAPEAPKPAGTDRLVLADADPAAARPAAEQAAKDAAEQAAKSAAREEAMTRQIEALTKEVARMREDMDKLATRNRELAKEAENSRTGWFAAAGLGIALAGLGLGLLGRREKKKTWRENLSTTDHDADEFATPLAASLPEVREEGRAFAPKAPVAVPKAAAVAAPAAVTGFHTTNHDISDLDITKIDVQESVGGGTLMNAGATTAVGGTTMFPSDLAAGTTFAEAAKTQMGPLKELDFSLDDIDLQVPTVIPKSPIFSPTTQVSPEESEAARAKLFEEIEQVHRASKKG